MTPFSVTLDSQASRARSAGDSTGLGRVKSIGFETLAILCSYEFLKRGQRER
jgi:hypothetical protein